MQGRTKTIWIKYVSYWNNKRIAKLAPSIKNHKQKSTKLQTELDLCFSGEASKILQCGVFLIIFKIKREIMK